MKYILSSLTILLFMLAGCSSSDSTIKGHATGLGDKTGVFLVTYENDKFNVLDSTLLRGGRFSFSVDNVYPRIAYIGFSRMQDAIPFILEKGEVSIDADFDGATVYNLKGTSSNELLSQYNERQRAFNKEMDSLTRENLRLFNEGDSTGVKAIDQKGEQLFNDFVKYRKDFISKNNASLAAAYLVSQTDMYRFGYSQVDSLLNLLSPDIEANAFTDKLKAKLDILRTLAPGNPAPDFTMPDPDGNDISLSSLKGKYVMLYFWAEWSPASLELNKEVLLLYDKYKDKGFTVLAVSLDTEKDFWIKSIKENRLNWLNVSQLRGWSTDILPAYDVTGIPNWLLIDKEGMIVSSNRPISEIDETLGKIFEAE